MAAKEELELQIEQQKLKIAEQELKNLELQTKQETDKKQIVVPSNGTVINLTVSPVQNTGTYIKDSSNKVSQNQGTSTSDNKNTDEKVSDFKQPSKLEDLITLIEGYSLKSQNNESYDTLENQVRLIQTFLNKNSSIYDEVIKPDAPANYKQYAQTLLAFKTVKLEERSIFGKLFNTDNPNISVLNGLKKSTIFEKNKSSNGFIGDIQSTRINLEANSSGFVKSDESNLSLNGIKNKAKNIAGSNVLYSNLVNNPKTNQDILKSVATCPTIKRESTSDWYNPFSWGDSAYTMKDAQDCVQPGLSQATASALADTNVSNKSIKADEDIKTKGWSESVVDSFMSLFQSEDKSSKEDCKECKVDLSTLTNN